MSAVSVEELEHGGWELVLIARQGKDGEAIWFGSLTGLRGVVTIWANPRKKTFTSRSALLEFWEPVMHKLPAPTEFQERRLVNKVLTFEVFERDLVTKKSGPVLATVKGWDALDDFLKSRGTALIRGKVLGLTTFRHPKGWDSTVVGMENHFSDGTVEVM